MLPTDRFRIFCLSLEEKHNLIYQTIVRRNEDPENDLAEKVLDDMTLEYDKNRISRGFEEAQKMAIMMGLRTILTNPYTESGSQKPGNNGWITIIPGNYDTYPPEGIDMLVTDGTHYDVANFLMSSSYVWMKTNMEEDDQREFKDFPIVKWRAIPTTNQS